MTTYATAERSRIPVLDTRSPTGKPAWPLVLVEGPEKAGKTWLAAQLTASDRFSRAFWLDWGESTADEYAALPGVTYEVIKHDGTWQSIITQIAAVKQEAQRALDNGDQPVLFVIDSMSGEWDQLKKWANHQTISSPAAQRRLRGNPGAEIPIPMNVWNDVHTRHYRDVMRPLMSFPGVVVITARGKETVAVDSEGKPIPGERDYRVDGHKSLAYDASVWVRLSRSAPPMVVGARSIHAGIRPGVDNPKAVPALSLEWLIWTVLLKDTDRGETRKIPVDEFENLPAESPASESPSQDHRGQQTASGPTTESVGKPAAETDWKKALEEAGNDLTALRNLYTAAHFGGAPDDLLAKIKELGKAAADKKTSSRKSG